MISKTLIALVSFACLAGTVLSLTVATEAAIRADLWALFRANQGNPQVNFPAKLVRLAFHDAVTFRAADGSGGMHAVLNSKCTAPTLCENSYPENAGLQQVIDFVAPTYAKYSTELSVADFWALAANIALDFSSLPVNARATVTPLSSSRFQFRWGRKDGVAADSLPQSRFPSAESTWPAIRAIFVTGMGLTATETTALLGAHSIGRLNPQNSGYSGPWDNQPAVFDNGYFTSMINRKWTFNRVADGRAGVTGTVSIWKTAPPGTPVDPNATSMLNADMALVIDNISAFTPGRVFDNNNPRSFVRNAETYTIATGFAQNNAQFMTAFASAFKKLTELGYPCLQSVGTTTCPTSPSKVAVPTFTALTATSATLSWTAPSSPTSAITGYTIFQNGVQIGTTAATVRTFTATGLSAATTYTFYVIASNASGASAVGGVGTARTAEAPAATAPSAPSAPTFSGVTSSSFFLSWTAPTSDGGSAIIEYQILQNGVQVGSVPATTLTFPVAGLTASTTYTFTIVAVNAVGATTGGPASVVTLPPPTFAPSAPSLPTFSEITSSSLTVSWTAPSSDGGSAITAYEILQNSEQIASVSGTTLSFAVSGLTPASTYVFAIRAVNAVGATTGAADSVTTLATAPSTPGAPGFSGLTASAVNVNWAAPASDGGSAIVEYQILQDGVQVASVPTSTFTFAATGLNAATTYSFAVRAVNAVGSATSAAASIKTLSAPGTVAAPTFSAVTGSSVTLSWWAPASGGSAITLYTVYRDGIEIGTTATLSFTATGLTASTTYSFSVKATNAVGTSASATSSAVTTLGAPDAVSAPLFSSTTATSTVLTWSEPSSNGSPITEYRVFRDDALVGTTATPTFTSTGLTAATTYTFTVVAVNAVGSSPASAATAVTTLNA